jgi:hypothetical protein
VLQAREPRKLVDYAPSTTHALLTRSSSILRKLILVDDVIIMHFTRHSADPSLPDADTDTSRRARACGAQCARARVCRLLQSALVSVFTSFAFVADAVVLRDAVRKLLERVSEEVEEFEYQVLVGYCRRLWRLSRLQEFVGGIFCRDLSMVHVFYSAVPRHLSRASSIVVRIPFIVSLL